MADIKFSEFPKATTSKDSDEIAMLQDGVNKMIPSPVLESKIINKTVSRLIEQGGASLNVINLKGVVPTYADLATITPTPSLNDAYQVEEDGLLYVYTENGFQADGDGFLFQTEPTGVVEEGNTQAVSGGEVYKFKEKVLVEDYSSPQLYNKENNTILGKYVDLVTGNLANNSLSASAEIIFSNLPIEKQFDINASYYISGRATTTAGHRYSLSFENSLGVKLKPLDINGVEFADFSTITGSSAFKIPPTAVKMYATVAYASQTALDNYINTFQVVKGNAPSTNVNYVEEYVKTDWSKLPDRQVTPQKTSFLEVSTNLYNGRFTPSTNINSIGEPVSGSNANLSDFIRIKPNTRYYFGKVGRWAIYKEDRITQVQQSTTGTVLSNSEGAWLRIVMINANTGTAQINESTSLLPYEPYYVRINGEDLLFESQEEQEEDITFKTQINKPYPNELTLNVPIDNDPSNHGAGMRTRPYTDILGIYQNLANTYPEYVTYEVKTNAPSGEPIVMVRFKPNVMNPDNYPKRPLKKIMITVPHTYEKNSVWCTAKLFEKICNDWSTSQGLEYLRWNVEFIVYPLMNPYGWTNNQRTNANGVDLERNYPSGWVQGTAGSSTYGGTAPLSETEVLSVYNTLNSEKLDGRLIAGISNHNFATTNNFVWVPASTYMFVGLADMFIPFFTNHMRKQGVNIPLNEYCGTTDNLLPGGTFGRQSRAEGINGTTFEVSSRFKYQENVNENTPESIKHGIDAQGMFLIYTSLNF